MFLVWIIGFLSDYRKKQKENKINSSSRCVFVSVDAIPPSGVIKPLKPLPNTVTTAF